jgi:hypothetical protein
VSEKIKSVLLVLAFGCFVLAAFVSPVAAEGAWYRRVHFGWAGLAFWSASLVF